MEEGLEVRGGLLEEVDLQLDGDRFRKENVISGEDVENTLDFEAQRMRVVFFFFFSFAIFSFQRRQNSASISKTLFFPPPRRCHCPLRPHVVLGPTLTGPVVVRTQRKSLGGKIKLSLIKLGMFPWVNKKERKGCTNFAAVGRGVRSEAADFLAVLWAASGLNKHLENHHLGHSAPVPSVLLSTFPKLFFPSAWYWSRQCQLHFFSLDSKLLKK